MNVKKPEDWYKIPHEEVRKLGGITLIKLYGSLSEFIMKMYPEYPWNVFKFQRLPNFFWNDKNNHIKFVNYLLEELNVSPNDTTACSQITTNDIKKYGGAGMIPYYSNLLELFKECIPNNNWNVKLLRKYPKNHWNDRNNIIEFLEDIKSIYGIKKMDDWYRLSREQIRFISGGSGLIKNLGSLYEILKIAYPDENWDKDKLANRSKKSSQRWLFIQTQKLFPGMEVIEDFILVPKEPHSPIELDIFIPKYNIGLEYQGIHHYHDLPSFGPVELYKDRDERKKEICKKSNVILISVPYTWNNSLSDLKKLIKEKIPNINNLKETL